MAMQTLWVAPWLIRVGGRSALEAATVLFWLNVGMLVMYWCWGALNPLLARRGLHAETLIAWGLPLSFALMALIILLGPRATGLHWTLYCMSCTVTSLAQPSVGMAFPQALAGRALSAYNLVMFAGVFVVQWGVGLVIDALVAAGLTPPDAFRAAMAVFLALCVAAWAWFLVAPPHNRQP